MESAERWRTWHQHELSTPGFRHSSNHPITEKIMDTIIQDARLVKNQGKWAYHVMDVGSGPNARFLHFLYNKIRHDVSVPYIHMSALDIADPGEFPDAIHYHPGDLTRIPAPDHSHEALVACTSADYVEDKEAAFSEMGRVLSDNGLLVMVIHDPKSPWVNQWVRQIGQQKAALEILGSASGRMDRKTRSLLKQPGIFNMFGHAHVDALWDEATKSKALRRAIRRKIDSHSLDRLEDLAMQLQRHHFKGIRSLESALQRHGFTKPTVIPIGDKTGRYYHISARKKTG